MSTISVVVVEDEAMTRAGLAAEPDIVVIGQARDGHEAIDLVLPLEPDVVLTDLRMPRLDGVAATRPPTSRATIRVR